MPGRRRCVFFPALQTDNQPPCACAMDGIGNRTANRNFYVDPGISRGSEAAASQRNFFNLAARCAR